MSYNLLAEGDLDLFELSQLAAAHAPLELFPIPAEGGSPDALGIALSSGDANDVTVGTLTRLIELLWSKDATVWDLMAGVRVAAPLDLSALERRILGYP